MISMALLSIIYISFISLGLPDALLGSAWPVMAGDIHAPIWGAGVIQMAVSFCTIISSLNAARLIRRFGTGKLTAISVGMTAASLLGIVLIGHYAFLFLLAIPLGLGAGAVDSALNNYVALHCEPRHMSWLHCFWGVGTIIGPTLLSLTFGTALTWRLGYLIVGVMQALLCASLFKTLPLWKKEGMQEEERNAKVLSVGQVLALPGAKAGMVMFLCYCAIEAVFLLWVPTYLVMARGMDKVQAAGCGALFCIGMTVGRALSGFMTLRFTPRQMVRIGQAVMLAGCALLFVPLQSVALCGVVVFGLGCAPIYPNTIQDTPVNYGAENSQAAIGVQMASAYVGSTFVPSIFGALANAVGYGVMPVFALAMTLVMTVLFNAQKRIVEKRQ